MSLITAIRLLHADRYCESKPEDHPDKDSSDVEVGFSSETEKCNKLNLSVEYNALVIRQLNQYLLEPGIWTQATSLILLMIKEIAKKNLQVEITTKK